MRKIDMLFVLLGIVVAACLTWYSYYSNVHREAAKISELVYLFLFPPSIGLMATENATKSGQVIIVLIAVAANGALYGTISAVVRKMFS